MNDSLRGRGTESMSLTQLLLREPLTLERETSLFILVSSLDVFMTYLLLSYGGFVEANPIANHVLQGFNIAGMVMYKFVLVAIATVTLQVVARRRPLVAKTILNVSTLGYCGVVIYGLTLLLQRTGLV